MELADQRVKLGNNVQTDAMNAAADIVGVSAGFVATTADLAAKDNEQNKTLKLACENSALEPRLLLGFADPPASKLARDNAAADMAAELAALAEAAGEGSKLDGCEQKCLKHWCASMPTPCSLEQSCVVAPHHHKKGLGDSPGLGASPL